MLKWWSKIRNRDNKQPQQVLFYERKHKYLEGKSRHQGFWFAHTVLSNFSKYHFNFQFETRRNEINKDCAITTETVEVQHKRISVNFNPSRSDRSPKLWHCKLDTLYNNKTLKQFQTYHCSNKNDYFNLTIFEIELVIRVMITWFFWLQTEIAVKQFEIVWNKVYQASVWMYVESKPLASNYR